MKPVRYSTTANRDVEEISNYLFDLNPAAAYSFLDRLDEICNLLAEQPFIGRGRPELGEAMRSFPVGNYLVLYSPDEKGIYVARVVFGGRDLPKTFRPS